MFVLAGLPINVLIHWKSPKLSLPQVHKILHQLVRNWQQNTWILVPPPLQKCDSSALSPVSIATPSSGVMSDVESIASVDTSTSMTPDFSKMSLGRGHGRPKKPVQALDSI